MSTIADQYYIKALDQYPYNLEESIENLNYALSYNNEHSGANYLMGKLHKEQLRDFAKAENYYQIALACNPENAYVCLDYILLLIGIKEYDKAEKLIVYTQKLKGVDLACLFQYTALKCEYQRKYNRAIRYYEKAIFEAYNDELIASLKADIKRVKSKKNLANKSAKRKQINRKTK